MADSKTVEEGIRRNKTLLAAYREKQSLQVIEKYESNPKNCLNCGEKISYEKRRNKFCSQSCAAIQNNLGVTRYIKRSRFCSCGKPKKLQNKYCQECADNMVYIKVTILPMRIRTGSGEGYFSNSAVINVRYVAFRNGWDSPLRLN